MASPFTARAGSVAPCCDIIRQGRTTLVTTVQMFKILGLLCLSTAYSLSVQYLQVRLAVTALWRAPKILSPQRSAAAWPMSGRHLPVQLAVSWCWCGSACGLSLELLSLLRLPAARCRAVRLQLRLLPGCPSQQRPGLTRRAPGTGAKGGHCACVDWLGLAGCVAEAGWAR